VERGDTGLGRDAYGLPRRRRPGEHRAYRPRGAVDEPADADEVSGRPGTEDDYYGQLLRRPDEFQPRPRLRQQGRPRLRQPGRFPPPGAGGYPSGGPANGDPANGWNPRGSQPNGGPGNGSVGGAGNGGPGNGGPGKGGPGNGRPVGGLGNGGLGNGGLGNGGLIGGPGYGGPTNGGPGIGGVGNGGSGIGGPVGGGGTGGPGNGGPVPPRQYWLPNGRRVPPGYDQPYRPQAPGAGGASRGRPGPGQAPGRPVGQDPLGDSWSRPGHAPGQAPPSASGGARGPYGAGWSEAREGQGSRTPYGIQGGPTPQETPGPVIRQRETAVPPERPTGTARSVASIAPDGLEAFARDLRALRAKAELDYPEMAEASHYTMKTLASAAGGLRLPTLPVAVAYVRACGGNVTEWEERWQKLAAKLTADAAKKRRDDDEHPEPSDAPAIEPPAVLKASAPEADPAPTEVYVITSAPPRQPGW
jgi:hypothetical protein